MSLVTPQHFVTCSIYSISILHISFFLRVVLHPFKTAKIRNTTVLLDDRFDRNTDNKTDRWKNRQADRLTHTTMFFFSMGVSVNDWVVRPNVL